MSHNFYLKFAYLENLLEVRATSREENFVSWDPFALTAQSDVNQFAAVLHAFEGAGHILPVLVLLQVVVVNFVRGHPHSKNSDRVLKELNSFRRSKCFCASRCICMYNFFLSQTTNLI